MTRNEIMKIAHKAGLHIATDVNWMPIISLEYAEKFANQIAEHTLFNIDPSKLMSYQEGYEAGRQAERERLQAFMRQMIDSYSLASDSNAIRERSNP
jgi:deoxyribodipyrimidine photolyase